MSPSARSALQLLVDLRHRHKVNPLPGAANDFRRGTLAMFTNSALRAVWADDVKDAFKMDATLSEEHHPGGVPRGDSRSTALRTRGGHPGLHHAE